jgi:hypothetical protein
MSDKQQKILEMAKDICRVKLNCNDVCNPISACDALRYAERAVEAGYSKQSGWISVDERLPEEYDTILCFNGSYVQASVFLDEFIEDDKYEGDPIRGVTHWMPLPEAPKMKGGNEGVKGTPNKTYYTPDEVRNMSMNEIRDNITVIRESMKRWRDE